MAFPASSGVVFEEETGRLYVSDAGVLTVMLPWSSVTAYRRRAGEADWETCEPELRVPATLDDVDPPLPVDARRYFKEIPDDVRAAIASYPCHHWRLLAWMGRCGTAATELSVSNPALAFMVASASAFRDGRGRAAGQAPVMLPYRRQREILEWLGFPGTELVRHIVRKITHAALDLDRLCALRDRLRVANIVERLAHVPVINASLLSLAADSTIVGLSPRLLDEIARRPDAVDPGLVADTVRMWRQMRPDGPAPEFDRADRIVQVHDTLVADLNARRPSRPGKAEFLPPYPGTDTIVPLTSTLMLREEGRKQHNCVASYNRRVAGGRYAVYRVLRPERTTLGLVRKRGRWEIDQLKGPCNQAVGVPTYVAVQEWLMQVRRASVQWAGASAGEAGAPARGRDAARSAAHQDGAICPDLFGDLFGL
jgi:hypothetical protein